MKVTKSTVEVYRLRFEENQYNWADITLDVGEKSGRISIASDWGNWSNYWGACGEGFVPFLCSLNTGYFSQKVGESAWFDHKKTLQNYRRSVLESRRVDDITADFAAAIWDEIKELELYDETSTFLAIAYELPNLHKFFDGQLDTCTDISPRFREFWNTAYKPFCEYLKQELQNVR